jgi:hypothetical protein
MSPPNLLECEASELAKYLLKHRFKGDAKETATFLLEGTSSLPNAEALSAQLMAEEEVTDNDAKKSSENAVAETKALDSADLGGKILSVVEVSMTTPRGKHQVTFYEQGLLAEQKTNKTQNQFVLNREAVKQMVCFPKPEDCRKPFKGHQDMILLVLREAGVEGVKGNQVCFQLPKQQPPSNDSTSWLYLLCSSLGLNKKRQVALVQHPGASNRDFGRYSFKSFAEGTTSTTTGGMPFVNCYKGVNDGVLYPLEEGLLFFK